MASHLGLDTLMTPTPPTVVLRILALKGQNLTAVEVSKAFNLSVETVRRIWRGETHRDAATKVTTSAEASLQRLLKDSQ
jgi:hypothetical protein